MDKNILIAVVLGLLVLISVVQAFQLNTLKDKVKEGKLTIGKASGSVATGSGSSGGGAGLPSNIQDLPSMVGGC